LANRHADLVMVAAHEIHRRRAHPAVEGGAMLGVFEERENRLAQLLVDHLGEAALAVVELLLDLLAQAPEALTHERRGLEALEERFADALDLRDRGRIAVRQPGGEAAQAVDRDPPQRLTA